MSDWIAVTPNYLNFLVIYFHIIKNILPCCSIVSLWEKSRYIECNSTSVIITPFVVNFQIEPLVQLPSSLSFSRRVGTHVQLTNLLHVSVMRKEEVRKLQDENWRSVDSRKSGLCSYIEVKEC
jgi:hypothetical protein